jgi:predicted nucleic acid-binding protein
LKISFVDSGVLIAAARGTPEMLTKARAILADRENIFASSAYVCLEVLPKASFYGQEEERLFYSSFFQAVRFWAPPDEALVEDTLDIAFQSGLSALDALHVASALAVGADELITSEKPGKPVHRVRGISVRTIHAPRS